MSGASKRYPPELRERAVRMVAECRHEHPSEWATIESVAAKLGIGTAQTLHAWVRRDQIDSGRRAGVTPDNGGGSRACQRSCLRGVTVFIVSGL